MARFEFKTGQQLVAKEQPRQLPNDKRIDQALAVKGHKRRPLQVKPEVVRPTMHQPYDSRGSSGHKAAYERMVPDK